MSLQHGRFVIRGLLGEGGQGTTYDALDHLTGRSVAVKRVDLGAASQWKDVELAEREARVLASLDHPGIARYVAHFEEQGALYLVMDRIEGETLHAMIRRLGPLPESEVRRLLDSAGEALDYLHSRPQPVVHRDVKPRNVLRQPDGRYVLVDFGAVRELSAGNRASTVVGTYGYMAPEQLHGGAQASSDVYALAATAMAMLTGLEPEALPRKGLKIDVRAALGGRVSADLIVALERMLEPEPDRRASSVAAARVNAFASVGSAPPAAFAQPAAPASPAAPAAGMLEPHREDAAVKSIRRLLWLLWCLGWAIVPDRIEDFVMFGSLLPLIALSWHKGALLRLVLRHVLSEFAARRTRATINVAPVPPAQGGLRVPTPPTANVRVSLDPMPSEEAFAMTERSTVPDRRVRL